jgi:hypothetical protein
VVVLGVTTAVLVVLPELHEYEVAPLPVKVVVLLAQIVGDAGVTVKLGTLFTTRFTVLVVEQPATVLVPTTE